MRQLLWMLVLLTVPLSAQEKLLSETENAYNPIPSADGKLIAYVRTGWGRNLPVDGLGRSHLRSEISVMAADGRVLNDKELADGFLAGWTRDGKALVCYRDREYWLSSLQGEKREKGSLPEWVERVAYRNNSFIWVRTMGEVLSRPRLALQTPAETIAVKFGEYFGEMLPAPSPDGRYIAISGPLPQGHQPPGVTLLIYDLQKMTWADFGPILIHPDANWDYIKPTWDPWFVDSQHIVYTTGSELIVSTPDGRAKKTIARPDRPHGLPVPSPDGLSVAFVTFEARPMSGRPDLKFWGGTTIWVTSSGLGSKTTAAREVTTKSTDTTYSLRWLGMRGLVFDRLADVPQYQKARLWKVSLPH